MKSFAARLSGLCNAKGLFSTFVGFALLFCIKGLPAGGLATGTNGLATGTNGLETSANRPSCQSGYGNNI